MAHNNPLCHLLPKGIENRQQILSILGLYQGHNQSQNAKLPQTPSCKGNRTTGFLKLLLNTSWRLLYNQWDTMQTFSESVTMLETLIWKYLLLRIWSSTKSPKAAHMQGTGRKQQTVAIQRPLVTSSSNYRKEWQKQSKRKPSPKFMF